MMWVLFALLSAFFAAVTSILAKIGIEGINSNLATAIRTVVVLIMAWGDCVCNRYPEPNFRYQQEKLDFSHSIRFGNRAFLAVLL